VKHNNNKNFSNFPQSKKSYSHDNMASSFKGHGKAPMKEQDHVPKGVCRHCKKEGHYMRDCVEFLRWLNMRDKNKCKDLITSIDESMYLDCSSYTWLIDLGATIRVINSLQGLSMRRTLPRKKEQLELQMARKLKLKPLESSH
jgi:hypothetical protein